MAAAISLGGRSATAGTPQVVAAQTQHAVQGIVTLAEAQKAMPFPIKLPGFVAPGFKVAGAQLDLGPQGVPLDHPQADRQVLIIMRNRSGTPLTLGERQLPGQIAPSEAVPLKLPSGQTIQGYFGPKTGSGAQIAAAMWRADGITFNLYGQLKPGVLSLSDFEKVIESLPLP